MSSQLQQRTGGKAAKFADMQLRAAQRMKRMIGELLDFTRNRPETGIPIQRKSVDFSELARISVDEIGLARPDVSVNLSIEGSCVGNWDADRLAQVCSNLIGNAIEHGSPNTPVTVALRGSSDAVALRVTNIGPPIPDSVPAPRCSSLFVEAAQGNQRVVSAWAFTSSAKSSARTTAP